MALAGFAGLVTLLGHARLPGNGRLNEVSFRSMMELSLTLAIFALLPFVPHKAALYGIGGLTGALLVINAFVRLETIAEGIYFAALFVHFVGASFFFIRLLYGSLTPITGSRCAVEHRASRSVSGAHAPRAV